MRIIACILLALSTSLCSCKDPGSKEASDATTSTPTASTDSAPVANAPSSGNTPQAPTDSAGQNYTYATTGELQIVGSETQYDIILPTDFLFDFDKDNLRPEAAPLLDKLKAHFATHKTSQVHVVGHTDSKGDNTYNYKLSQRRAIAVQKWLKTNTGVYAMAIGRGEEEPTTANENPDGSDNQQGRQLNRRVVIRVVAYPDVNKELSDAKANADAAKKSINGADTRKAINDAKAQADAAKAGLK